MDSWESNTRPIESWRSAGMDRTIDSLMRTAVSLRIGPGIGFRISIGTGNQNTEPGSDWIRSLTSRCSRRAAEAVAWRSPIAAERQVVS